MPFDSTPRMMPAVKVIALPGMKVPTGEKTERMPGTSVGCAAHDLNGRGPAGVDRAHAQPIGVGMRPGFDHACDDEAGEPCRGIDHVLDLEADARQRVDDFCEVGLRVEMVA